MGTIDWRTKIRRTIRYSGLGERLAMYFKKTTVVALPELGITHQVGPGDLVIDCGANVGDITSRFARTGATVHAFEPNPICFDILRKRFGGTANVILHNKGVMAEPGVLPLRIPRIDGLDAVTSTVASSFLDREINPLHDDDEVVEIECVDFPAFVMSLDPPVKLLKMDIEGAEVAVLDAMMDRGAMDRIEFAIVETHDRFSPEQAASTDRLRERIARSGMHDKIRLDWV